MKYRNEIIVFAVVLAVYSASYFDKSPYTAHVYQAVAFLHGHADVNTPDYIERAVVDGKRYQLHPPLPAVLLMPFAAIWGLSTNQNWFALVVGALDAALMWRLLGKVG